MMALLLTKTYCCPKERPLGSPKVSRRKFHRQTTVHGFPNGIALEVGRPKNSKKNLFSEHDIEEHGLELLNICPEGDPASLVTLWPATAVVNTHIRSVRPYARERHVLTQLRLLTGEYLAVPNTRVNCITLNPPKASPEPFVFSSPKLIRKEEILFGKNGIGTECPQLL